MMTSLGFRDVEERFSLANELHARPFPRLDGDGQAILIALRQPSSNPEARASDFAKLTELLDRHGAAHPPTGANHHWADLGRYRLKWERHTEMQTYTLFKNGPSSSPFDMDLEPFPMDWRESLTGEVITAAHIQYVRDEKADLDKINRHFERESLAVAEVLDNSATAASDFRIDGNGFVRFLVVAKPDVGPQRLGRIVQRLFEIETYRAMAMLSFPAAREVGSVLARLGPELSAVVSSFADGKADYDASLSKLLEISAHLEDLNARFSSRFSAAEAYSAIVTQRIEVLREVRVRGRQTFSEFMTRRFEPAMRTCASTRARLDGMAAQAARAGDLLRTRTDVDRAEQNQKILERMDERAAQQLKLQKTVEGLSVVAVSYYAVNLAAYLLGPFAEGIGIGKTMLTALVTLPIILIVWWMIRKLKENL